MTTSDSVIAEAKPTLRALIARVVDRRAYEFELVLLVNAARMAWEEEHANLLTQLKTVSGERIAAEEALRAGALEAFTATGSKKPAPGVGVRTVTRLVYAPDDALNWAKEHNLALQLDTKAFEKIAKAAPLPFVTTSEESQATLSPNLDIAEAVEAGA